MNRFKGFARPLAGLAGLILVGGTVVAPPVHAATGHIDFDRTWQLLAVTNTERVAHGLPKMAMDHELLELAALRAREVSTKFSHARPDGQAWHTAFPSAYAWPVGENIAFGQPTAQAVHSRWMSSELHRANIIDPDFRSLGVVAWVEGQTVYWVEDFTSTVVTQMDWPGVIVAPRTGQVGMARTNLTKVRPKAGGEVVIKLKPVAGASGYGLELASNKKFSRGRAVGMLDSTQTRASIRASLIPGRRYWLKARPFMLINGKRKYGRWSTAVRFRAR